MTITKDDRLRQARHDRLLTRIERPYRREIAKEKNRFIEEIALHYSGESTIPEEMSNNHRLNMHELGERYNTIAIELFALDNARNLTKEIAEYYRDNLEVFDKWLAQEKASWIFNETGKAAKQTSVTTVNDIKAAIFVATEAGETSNRAIAQQILRAKGFTPFRANVIAVTETHNAAMYANKRSAERLSIGAGVQLVKKWVPVQDARTRDIHSDMAGHEPVSMSGFFSVGNDRMDRPGDPRGSAENIIRCRCSLSYETVN